MNKSQAIIPAKVGIQENELPQGWVMTTLGKITQPIKKVKPADKPQKEIFYLDIGGIDKATNSIVNYKKYLGKDAPSRAQQAIKKGDIAFANVRPYLRNIAIVPNDLNGQVGSTGFCFLRPAQGIDYKYIYYWVLSNTFINDITKYQKGSSYPAVTNKQILERDIPLAPPEQQKRIVAKIEELFSHIDAGIEALKKAKQLLKQYRRSVLKAAVTGELTKEWREANNLSQESWQESTIGEIARVQTGKTPKRSDERYWKHGTIPWLTSAATNDEFTHYAEQFVTQSAVDDGLKLFEPGTLLLAMYGEGKTRGQVTEITFQATCNQACAAIIVDEEKVNRAFVRLRLYENYEETRKAASGGNQPNLNLSKVREISLPLPPLSEQLEIILQAEQKFEAIRRLEKELETQILKAEKNKQSVLASAFSGKIHQ